MKCFIVVFALVALSHGYSIGGGLYGGQILGQGQVLGVTQGVLLPGVVFPLSQSGIIDNVLSQNIPIGLKLSLLQLIQQQQISNPWNGVVGGYQIPIQSSIDGIPVVQSGLTQVPVSQEVAAQGLLGNVGVQGLLGNVGVQGLLGNVGVQGQLGNVGVQGQLENVGLQGLLGNVGVQGQLGNVGVQGLLGNVGINQLGNVGVNQLGLNSLWQNLGQPVVGPINSIWNGQQILGNTVGQQIAPLVY